MRGRGSNHVRRADRRGMAACWACAVATALASCGAGRVEQRPAASLSPGDHTFQLRHGGRLRSYIVHVPGRSSGARALTGEPRRPAHDDHRCGTGGVGLRLAIQAELKSAPSAVIARRGEAAAGGPAGAR